MPPKKDTGPSKKTVQKEQNKIIEDKTFGLKNKNKSKVVQKFIKGVEKTVKDGQQKGGEQRRLNEQKKLEEQQKKDAEKDALLSAMFRTVLAAGGEKKKEEPRVEEKIDLYTDQRELIHGKQEDEDTMDGWDEEKLKLVTEEKELKYKSQNKTDKVCMHFLDAVEKRKYGWFWNCPNGENCIYKHCLPPGYVLKGPARVENKEERTLEEILEEERAKLTTKGTPITLDTFKKWREDKLKRKEQEIEKKRQEEVKKNKGGKGFNILSGRALFKYDPSLFADDEGAADDDAYDNREEYEDEDKEERKVEEAHPVPEEDDDEEEDADKNGEEQNNADNDSEKNVEVNADVFLDEEDVDLPE